MRTSTLKLNSLKNKNATSLSEAVQQAKTVITKKFTPKIFAFWAKFIVPAAA